MSYGDDPAETGKPSVTNPLVYHIYGRIGPRRDGGKDAAVSEFDIHERNAKIVLDGRPGHGFFPREVRDRLRSNHLYVGFSLRDPVLLGLLHALDESHACEGAKGFAIAPRFEIAAGADQDAVREFADPYLTKNGPCDKTTVLWEFPRTLSGTDTDSRAERTPA